MRRLWLAFWMMLGAAFALTGFMLWWALNPSANYIRVTGYTVEHLDGEWFATSGRDLPYGDVVVDWTVALRVLRPEATFVCRDSGTDTFHVDAGPTVRYKISPWADDCLDSNEPVSVTVTRQVRAVWGLIPLRPVSFQFTINQNPDLPPNPGGEGG